MFIIECSLFNWIHNATSSNLYFGSRPGNEKRGIQWYSNASRHYIPLYLYLRVSRKAVHMMLYTYAFGAYLKGSPEFHQMILLLPERF